MQRQTAVFFSFIFIVLGFVAQAQNVVNPSFENWHSLTNQNNIPYEEPVGWKTPNQYTVEPLAGSFQGVQKHASIVHSGNFSMRLSSKLVPFINKIAPGAATNGDFRLLSPVDFTYEIVGGQAYSLRPEKYRGYYQYSPVAGDSCIISVELSKWDAVNKKRSTVGRGIFTSGVAKVSWTPFDVPITYLNCNTPDTLLITISASKLDGSSGDGSIMYVDSNTLENAPRITSQPTLAVVCNGQAANFSLSTEGTGLTYQWQENTGSGFSDLTDGGIYSNTQNTSFDISTTSLGMNNHQYRCIVSRGSCAIDTTQTVSLVVNNITQVTGQPVSLTACAGDSIGFNTVAQGGQLTYQWQVNTNGTYTNLNNTGSYRGAQSASLSVNPVTASLDGLAYRCLVDGLCGNEDTSMSATLTVNSVSITRNPTDSIVCDGAPSAFSVVAIGNGLIYEWQVDSGAGFTALSNGGVYSGVDQPTLLISSTNSQMNSLGYRVVVGACSSPVISNTAFLSVRDLPKVDLQPLGQRISCTGEDITIGLVASGLGLTYQWQSDMGSGFTNLTNGGVYADIDKPTLKLNGTTAGMNGHWFRCVVSGTCTPADTSSSVLLSMLTKPVVHTQPLDIDACVGEDTLFTIAATGDSLVYQWQFDDGLGFSNLINNATYAGVNTATLSLTNIQEDMDNTRYRCRVGICNPPVYSDLAFLSVKELPIASFIYQVFGDSVTFTNISIGGDDFIWDFGDNSNTVLTRNASHRYTQSGDYDVTLSVTNDCITDDTTITISVTVTGLEDVLAAHSFKLYPNPVNETFYLEQSSGDLKINTLFLTDIQGRRVDVSWQLENGRYMVNTNDLKSGLYFLQVATDKGSWFSKLSVLE